jgi:hypothetical protein
MVMPMELPPHGEIFEEASRLTLEPREGTKDKERGFAMMMYLAQNTVLEAPMVLGGLFAKGKGCIQSEAFSRYWLRRYFFLLDEANSTNESEGFETENSEEVLEHHQKLLTLLENESRENTYNYQDFTELLMWAQVKPGDILQGSNDMDYGSFHLSDDSAHSGVFGINLLNCLDRGIGAYFHTDFTANTFYHYFRYGDLAMLELMGDVNAYYPYDIDWSTDREATITMDDEFLESIQPMTYQDEYQPLFPFNSRELLKKNLISIGIENPKFGLINTKFGYFFTFRLSEAVGETENDKKFTSVVGQIIKWYLPRGYPIMFFPTDDLATEDL